MTNNELVSDADLADLLDQQAEVAAKIAVAWRQRLLPLDGAHPFHQHRALTPGELRTLGNEAAMGRLRATNHPKWRFATLLMAMHDAQGRRLRISRKQYSEIAAKIIDPRTGKSYNPSQGTNHGYVAGLQGHEVPDEDQQRWVADAGTDLLVKLGFDVTRDFAD